MTLDPAQNVAPTIGGAPLGDDEGQTYKAFVEVGRFLCKEVKDEFGYDVEIPIDRKGADILFIPASADLISFPETHRGVAVFFEALRRIDGTTWTMSSKAFDGANFGLFTGGDAHMNRKNQFAKDACLELAVKALVIGECGHAYRIAKRLGPTASKNKNAFKTINVAEVITGRVAAESWARRPGRTSSTRGCAR